MHTKMLGCVLVVLSISPVDSFQYSRVDKRLDMLEDKVYYESRTVREDLQKIFGLLNKSVTNSSSGCQDNQKSFHSNDCSLEHAKSIQSEFDNNIAVVKRAFADEKAWIRSHAQELKDTISRVKRDMQADNQRMKESFENLEGEVTQSCTAVKLALQTLSESMADKLQTLEKLATANSKDVNDMKGYDQVVLNKLTSLSELLLALAARIDNDNAINSVKDMERKRELKIIRTTLKISLLSQSSIFNDVYQFGASVYVFGSEDMNWSAAMKNCESIGAHLPYVESKEENEFLSDLGKKLSRGKYGMWLGARDEGHEGIWMWEPVNRNLASGEFVNWLNGQPDNNGKNENCLHIWSPRSGWNDIPCENSWAKMSYLCEIDML